MRTKARKPKKNKPPHPSPPLPPAATIGSCARIIITGGKPTPKFLERMIVKTKTGQGGTT